MKSFLSIAVIALLGLGVQAHEDGDMQFKARCMARNDNGVKSRFVFKQEHSMGAEEHPDSLFFSGTKGVEANTNYEYRLVEDCAEPDADTSMKLGKFHSNADGRVVVRGFVQEDICIENGDLDGMSIALICPEGNVVTCCELNISEPMPDELENDQD